MSSRPHSISGGASSRSAADHDLSHLFDEVVAARAADRRARGPRRPDDPFRSDARRLAVSLGAYANALERYRLPVPPAIRDELRLRSGLPS
jgi:hypothetical protein